MRNKLFLIFIIILPQLAFSQNKVIVSKNNTFKFGDCVLINAPLPTPESGVVSLRSILIENQKKIIPTDPSIVAWRLPFGFYIDSIIVANKGKPNEESAGYLLFGNNTICEINRIDDIEDDLFSYRRIQSPKQGAISKDSTLIYYTEARGSLMSADTQRINFLSHFYSSLPAFIDSFEKKYHVKIGKRFAVTWGDEGETTYFFTLSGLTSQQKIRFIYERTKMYTDGDRSKNKLKTISVFFPLWVSNRYLNTRHVGGQ